MNRFILSLTLFCSVVGSTFSQQLSDKAEIVVLTLGPDPNELYAAFGHSAFRVVDRAQNLDRVYNYGVFDFNQPNFYLNFARGYLNYKLDTVDYPRFRYVYMYYNRFIHEQILNLNQEQKQKVFDYLQNNMLPENQYYYYDYFYDNCATKIRDVLKASLGDELIFDGSYIDTDYSIRELTDLYLDPLPWGDLGIDICLGLPMDKKATPEMYMFLPDYIESAFDNASLKTDSADVPLVRISRATFTPKNVEISSSLLSPIALFTILLVLILVVSFRDHKRKKASRWLDVTLMLITGLLGLLFFLLWVATDHNAAARNMNLLWALPTNLIVAFVLFKKNLPAWVEKYVLFALALTALLLVSWFLLPQLMPHALLPLVVGLAIRYLVRYKFA